MHLRIFASGALVCAMLACAAGSSSLAIRPALATRAVATPVPALGIGASLKGRRPFPAANAWNQRVDKAAVDPSSANLIASIGASTHLHPDFGANYDGGPFGIPYVVVSGKQAKVPVSFEYADESDPGPYPIPAKAPIEGGANSDGDRHVIVIDRDHWRLYELYAAHPPAGATGWTAGSGAVFNLRTGAPRPAGWTSADAAGLPIFPGLVRYDEVVAGHINHALRFTVSQTPSRVRLSPHGISPVARPVPSCRRWAPGCGSRRRSRSRATRGQPGSSCRR